MNIQSIILLAIVILLAARIVYSMLKGGKKTSCHGCVGCACQDSCCMCKIDGQQKKQKKE